MSGVASLLIVTQRDTEALGTVIEEHEPLAGDPLWRCGCGWEPGAVWHDGTARYDEYRTHVAEELLAALPATDMLAQARRQGATP